MENEKADEPKVDPETEKWVNDMVDRTFEAERKDKEYLASLQKELADLRAERDKLKEFKEYVHKRLDDAGIPVDPESPHKASGCRIGGRLDVTFNRMVKLEADNERLKELIKPFIEMWFDPTSVGSVYQERLKSYLENK